MQEKFFRLHAVETGWTRESSHPQIAVGRLGQSRHMVVRQTFIRFPRAYQPGGIGWKPGRQDTGQQEYHGDKTVRQLAHLRDHSIILENFSFFSKRSTGAVMGYLILRSAPVPGAATFSMRYASNKENARQTMLLHPRRMHSVKINASPGTRHPR